MRQQTLDARQMQTVCILRLSALGDVCNVLPAIGALQAYCATLRLTWLVGQTEYQLLRNILNIDFVVYDKRSRWRGMRSLWRKLPNEGFDALLHMQHSLRASLLSLGIKSPHRIGFDRARSKDYQRWFVNQTIASRPDSHVVESYLDFVSLLGVNFDEALQNLRWDLPIDPSAFEDAKKFMPQAPYILISPCANARYHNYRNWHAAGYAEVIRYAWHAHRLRTILTGGCSEAERKMAQAITQLTHDLPKNVIHNCLGQTPLATLLALIKQAKILIAPDSGPIHMANALNTPVIALFATTNPKRAGPYRWQEYVVNCYPQAVERYLHKTVETVPWGTRVRHPEAMQLIQARDVIAQFERLVHEKSLALSTQEILLP